MKNNVMYHIPVDSEIVVNKENPYIQMITY